MKDFVFIICERLFSSPMPLDCPPGFGSELGWPNDGPNRLGRSVYLRALPFFFFLVQRRRVVSVSVLV